LSGEAVGLQRCAGDGEGFPLSLNQSDMWYHCQLHGEPALNNLSRQVLLRGPLDRRRLVRALQAVVDRQDSLRTVFAAHEGGPRQRIVPEVAVACPIVDLRGLPAAEVGAVVAARHRELAGLPFDLGEPPLLRMELAQLDEDQHVLLCVFHNLVLDGLNFAKFLDDVGAAYSALGSGGPATQPPLPLRYPDFAAWQDERLRRGELAEHEDYWLRQLEPPVPETRLARDRDPGLARSFEKATLDRSVPAETFRGLDALAKPYHTTLFRVVLAAFEVLLQRVTGEPEVLLGVPFSLRPPKLHDVLGFFGHAVPIRASAGGRRRFCDLLAEVNHQLAQARAHMEYPLGAAVRKTRLGVDLSRPILPIYVAQERNVALKAGDLSMTTGPALVFEVYDLMLAVFPTAEGLSLTYCYSADLFDAQTIAHLADSFEGLLAQIAADPEVPISKLRLGRLPEGRAAGAAAIHDRGPWPEELIAQRAREDPDRVAFVSGAETWTYGELDRRADRLARRLRSAGVSPEQRVGILGRRSPVMWAAVLAVLNAGAAFVPLDPEDPEVRLRALVGAAGLRCLAVGAGHEELAAAITRGTGCQVLRWDAGAEAGGEAEAVTARASGNELACVFYTSGSTGAPKGVMVERAGMRNHLHAKVEELRLDRGDVMLQNASHCFDVSVWQALAPLMCGGRVVICDDECARDPEGVLALVKAEGVTILETVPSFLELMLGLAEAPEALLSLKYLVSNAETLPVPLSRRWFERCRGIALVNTWGATECSDDVTHQIMTEPIAAGRARVGVGRAIAGAGVHVLDEELQPLPPGAAGQLAVAGVCVGRGYLSDAAATARAFVPDPFARRDGGRLYLTGDLGRFTSDGALEFLGRRDGQVKVRGHRVEVGEVEGTMATHSAVRQAAVAEKDGRLVGYWVGTSDLEMSELRAHLADTLPAYMVPDAFVRLDALPRTHSGKVDRRALPPPGSVQGRPEYLPPRTELERRLAQVWEEVLAVGRVGVHDNFFDLGGHSLSATRIVLSLQRDAGIAVSIRELFQAATVAGLAALAEGRRERPPATEGILRLGERPEYPLSVAQTAQWLGFHRLVGARAGGWGFPEILRIDGALEVERLREALRALVARHESLRTSFVDSADGPRQALQRDVEIECPLHDLSSSQGTEQLRTVQSVLMQQVLAPLDGRPPLLRTRLIRLRPDRHLVTMQMPHIVTDGWTDEILAEDLADSYMALERGRPAALEPNPIRYVDFASWQNARLDSPALRAEKDYWLERFADGGPVLKVPRQRKQPALEAQPRRSLHLQKDLVTRMRKLAASRSTTLFVALLASFEALLARLTGNTDLVVGTPVAGRIHPALDRVAGLFMNPLALRSDLSGDPTFVELLDRVRETMLGALANQEYPFPEWLQELRRRHGRQGLYPYSLLLFVQEGVRGLRFGSAAGVLESCQAYGIGAAPQVVHGILGPTLSLFVAESADEWRADVFDGLGLDRDFVAELLPRWSKLVTQVLDRPTVRLSELDLLLDRERGGAGFAKPTELDADLSRVVQAYRERGGVAALCGDGTVSVGDGPDWVDPLSLVAFLARREATVLVADGKTLLRLAEAAAATATSESLPLRRIVVADVASAAAIRRRWPGVRVSAFAVLHRETDALLWVEEVEESDATIAGRLVGRAQVQVLDPWGRPSPIGIEGEIHVAHEDTGRLLTVSRRGRWRGDGVLEIASARDSAARSRADRRRRFDRPAYLAPRTALERQIAAAWRAVLSVDAGILDDFVGLGGSVDEAVEVSARLGSRNLLALPAQVLRHRTVESLAAVVEENGRLRRAARDPEPDRPTPVQRALLAAALEDPAAAVSSVELRAPAALDQGIASEALRLTAREHDALCLRFRKDGGLWLSFHEAEAATVTRALDLAGVREDRRLRQWRAALDVERRRLSPSRPGLHAVIAGDRLVLLTSATAVDEASWPLLVEAFERAYTGLVTGRPVGRADEPRSFHAWLAAADRLAAFQDPTTDGAMPTSIVGKTARWRIAGPLGGRLAALSPQAGDAALAAAIRAVLPDASVDVEGDRRGRGSGVADLTRTVGQFGRMPITAGDAGAATMVLSGFVTSPPARRAGRRFELLRFDPARILVGAHDLRVIALAYDGVHLALQWSGRHALVGRAAARLRRGLRRALARTLDSAAVEAARFDTVELNPDELEKLIT
jgi:amino acid adenylation domain-containing protein